MHFGENQLFPSSFGISPALPTAHPRVLPHSQVRASTQFYLSFTLAMGRSLGFGFDPCDSIALFRLAFAPAPQLKLLNFQILFHSPPGVLFTFPSRYWFTIGHQQYLALEGGPPRFPRGSPCPVVLKNTSRDFTLFAYGTLTLYSRPFQKHSARRKFCNSAADLGIYLSCLTTPEQLRFQAHLAILVWALPLSFATT